MHNKSEKKEGGKTQLGAEHIRAMALSHTKADTKAGQRGGSIKWALTGWQLMLIFGIHAANVAIRRCDVLCVCGGEERVGGDTERETTCFSYPLLLNWAA